MSDNSLSNTETVSTSNHSCPLFLNRCRHAGTATRAVSTEGT